MNIEMIQTVCNEIIDSLKARYPDTDFSSVEKKIIDYLKRQIKGENLIDSYNVSNGIGKQLTTQAYDERYIDGLVDKNGKPIPTIDIQKEIYLVMRVRFIKVIDRAEQSLVGSEMFYDQRQRDDVLHTSRNRLDFSRLEDCGHLLGLPTLEQFRHIIYNFNKNAQQIKVRFPEHSSVSIEPLKSRIKNFLENVTPHVRSLREFREEAMTITLEVKNFYEANRKKLSLEDSQELSNIMRLLSNHIKNMERLFYNDVELQVQYLKSDDFSFDLITLLDREDLYIQNKDGSLTPFAAIDYIDNYSGLLQILHQIVDQNRNPVFTFLGNKPLHKTIVQEMAKKNPFDMITDADEIDFNDIITNIVDQYLHKDRAVLSIIENSCNTMKYVPKEKMDDVLLAIDFAMEYYNAELDDKLVNIFTDLKTCLLKRQNKETIETSYDPEKYYLLNNFKKDLLSVLIQVYGKDYDIRTLDLKEFYVKHKDMFPYEVSQFPVLKKPEDKVNDLPFVEQYKRLLVVDDLMTFRQLYTTVINQIKAHFELNKDNLDIEDYFLYRHMKYNINNRSQALGHSNPIQEEKLDKVNDEFDFSFNLSSCASMLDSRRVKIDMRTNMARFLKRISDKSKERDELVIGSDEDFDPLLLFRYLCSTKDGMERFIDLQDKHMFNFAKMVSKYPIFDDLCDITFANIEFFINDNTKVVSHGGVRLDTKKEDKAYKIVSLKDDRTTARNAKIIHFRDKKALATMKSLGIDPNVYAIKGNMIAIPNDYYVAAKVA